MEPVPYTAVDLDDPVPAEEQSIIDSGWAAPDPEDAIDARFTGYHACATQSLVPGGGLIWCRQDPCVMSPPPRTHSHTWELTDPPRRTEFRCLSCGASIPT
mgnify:CR=1 FL=1